MKIKGLLLTIFLVIIVSIFFVSALVQKEAIINEPTTTKTPGTTSVTESVTTTVVRDPTAEVITSDCTDSDGLNFFVSGVLTVDSKDYSDSCEGNFAVDHTCPSSVEKKTSFIGNIIRSIGNIILSTEPIKNTKDCSVYGSTYVCEDGACVDKKECISGETSSCGSDIGECIWGTKSCINGFWDPVCYGEVGPKVEICDDLDNDCDGAIDEDLDCSTDSGDSEGTTDLPSDPEETPDCYDSDDGKNIYEAGWTAYINPDKFPGVVISSWPNPSPSTVYRDYCKYDYETGKSNILVDYNCGGLEVKMPSPPVETSISNEPDSDVELLAVRDKAIAIDKKVSKEAIDSPDEPVTPITPDEPVTVEPTTPEEPVVPITPDEPVINDPTITALRPDSKYYAEETCVYGCHLGRCLKNPLEVFIDSSSYVWASPVTHEGVIKFNCQALAYELSGGIKKMELHIVANNEDGDTVVDFTDSVDCNGEESCRIPANSLYGYNDGMIDGFWEAFPGDWNFTCTAYGQTKSDSKNLVIHTDNCQDSYCPPSRGLTLYPIYNKDYYMVVYDSHANSEELRNLYVRIEKKDDPNPPKEFNIDCDHDRCTFFGVYAGSGTYTIKADLYDYSANVYSLTRGITI